MPTTSRWITPLGALLAAAGVALGAYSAHGLDRQIERLGYAEQLDQRVDWFETGVRYHLYHALGIMLAGVIGNRKSLKLAALMFVVGVVLFSGSLYVMALAPEGWRWLGAVVPLGGLSFIAGWLVLSWSTGKNTDLVTASS